MCFLDGFVLGILQISEAWINRGIGPKMLCGKDTPM
jgi:hypothetical protein